MVKTLRKHGTKENIEIFLLALPKSYKFYNLKKFFEETRVVSLIKSLYNL